MCDPFSNLVFKVSRMLTKEDLDALAYLYRLPVDVIAVGSSSNGLPYLRELERRDTFSSSNLNGLKELLNNVQRCDLLGMVEEFEKDRQKFFTGIQICTRPQEECVRLDMSYAQARKTEEELTKIKKEFTAFCSKVRDAPGVTQFYNETLKHLERIKEECHQYITIPLREILHCSYLPPVSHHMVASSTLAQSSPGLSPSNAVYDTLAPIIIGNEQATQRDCAHSVNTRSKTNHLPQYSRSRSLNRYQIQSGTTQHTGTSQTQRIDRRRCSKSSSAVSAPATIQLTVTSPPPLKRTGSGKGKYIKCTCHKLYTCIPITRRNN